MNLFKMIVLTISTVFLLQGCGGGSSSDETPILPNTNITGVWTNNSTGNELLALVFFDDGTYVHIEVDEELPLDNSNNEKSGMEWGTYSIDSSTGQLSTSQTFDNNGDTGFTDILTRFASVSNGILTIQVDENKNGTIENDESFEFVQSESNNFLGAWKNDATNNDLLVLVFFDDGTYVHLEVDEELPLDNSNNEKSGMEWGTYSIDSSTGQLSTTQTFDNNGDTGFTDILTRFASVSNGVLTIQIDENKNGTIENDESLEFQRQ